MKQYNILKTVSSHHPEGASLIMKSLDDQSIASFVERMVANEDLNNYERKKEKASSGAINRLLSFMAG